MLHSSSTPVKNSRRFLLWNLTGMVLSRDENTYAAIEVRDKSPRSPPRYALPRDENTYAAIEVRHL